MQAPLPMPVLNSEAVTPTAMTDTSAGPAPPETDETLMLSFSHGSSEAFTELFHRYRQPIHGFFYRRLSDPTHAEELAQEAFLALIRSVSRYEPRASFRTYLYAIALKILRAYRRKAAFRATFFGRSLSDPAKQDATESALLVRRAIAKLDPIEREILLLREFEQLSYSEIGGALHLPVNTVRSRLFRARMAFRQMLEERAPQPAPQDLPALGEHT
jgi:RNA polymerase sigma-70 factor, ECF subfamily